MVLLGSVLLKKMYQVLSLYIIQDEMKLDLRERGWNGVDWIDLAQDRDQWRAFVNTVMNLRVP
jgi:hypothetical protein